MSNPFLSGGGSNPFLSSNTQKTKQDDLESLRRQLENAQFRLEQAGVDQDQRNPLEKFLNLPEKQNAFFDILDVIDRPRQTITNMISAKQDNKDNRSLGEAAWDGFAGHREVHGSELLDGAGMEKGIGRSALGFGVDVLTDPLTYTPAAAFKVAGKGIGNVAKAVTPQRVQDGLGMMGDGLGYMFKDDYGLPKEVAKRNRELKNSVRYQTDKASDQITDLATTFSQAKPELIGRQMEKDLKIELDPMEFIEDVTKGRNPKFNMNTLDDGIKGEHTEFVGKLNQFLQQTPEITERVAKLQTTHDNTVKQINKYMKDNDVPAIFEKHEQGLRLTKEEEKAMRQLLKLNKRRKNYAEEIEKLNQGFQFKQLDKGKGYEVTSPKHRVFANALKGKEDDFINLISPKKSFDEMVPDSKARPVFEELLQKGSATVAPGSTLLEQAKRLFGDDVKVNPKKGTMKLDVSKYLNKMDDETAAHVDEVNQMLRAQEDSFVQGKMSEAEEKLQRQMSAEAEWEAIKELKREFKNLRKNIGKIVVPAANKNDWSIPHSFKTAKKGDAVDLYQASEIAGYGDDIDGFVDYLNRLDQANKTKLKDLMPNNPIPKNQYDNLEDALRSEFKKTDQFKAVNETLQMMKPKPKSLDELEFIDRIEKVNVPRPVRDYVKNDHQIAVVAKELMDSNEELRKVSNALGVDYGDMEGYMRHILTEEYRERLAKSASTGKGRVGGNKAVVKNRENLGSVEDVNELVDMEKFEPNAYFATAEGQHKLIQYMHAEHMAKQFFTESGDFARYAVPYTGQALGKNQVKIRPDQFKFFRVEGPNGKSFAIRKGDEFVVDKSIANLLTNWNNRITDQGMNSFVEAFDKMHDVWKKFALFSAGFHVRNFLGNNFNMWIAGMRPDDLVRYVGRDSVWDIHQAKELGKIKNSGKELTERQKEAVKMYDEFKRQGLIEGSVFENEFRFDGGADAVMKRINYESKGNLGKLGHRAKHPFETSRDFGIGIDERNRYAMFKWAKNKGMSDAKAAEKVREALFDYSDLSTTEREVFKRVMPFYTWIRKNSVFQVKNFLTQPGKYAALEKGRQASLEATGMDEEQLPEWLNESFALAVSGDGEGSGKLLGLNLPAADLPSMANPMRMFTDSLTPLIKTPLELGTNYDMFRGKPIEEFEGETAPFLGTELPARLSHLLNQFGAVRNLSGHVDRAEKGDWFNILTGNMLKDQDAEKAELFDLLDQISKNEELMKLYQQETGSRPPTINELRKLGITKPGEKSNNLGLFN